jgi:hypothetical protein
MLFTCARSIHINTDRKELKQVLHFRFSFEPRVSEDDKSRHVMYTVVDRYYMTMKERLGASLGTTWQQIKVVTTVPNLLTTWYKHCEYYLLTAC